MIEPRIVEPLGRLRGAIRVPGDKSASHRALMISALADGESTIVGLSPGLDVVATAVIMGQLGATRSSDGDVVTVVGPSNGLRPSDTALDCVNSGTTMRLVAGIASAVAGRHRLVGDQSLSRRPMDRVARPLALMGSVVSGQGEKCTAPLSIDGRSALRAIEYHVPNPSAQVKSAVLFAALRADGHSVVIEDVRTRSTTEDMLRHAGVTVNSVESADGRTVNLTPGRPSTMTWRIPGDPSQGAFFAVLGAIHRDAEVDVLSLDDSPERIGYVGVLRRMGARISLERADHAATLRSRSSDLVATEVFAAEIPSLDEVPILAVAAAAATGISAFRDMSELRIKESDRLAGSMQLVAALGCRTWCERDDFFVEGLGTAGNFQAFSLAVGLDHRMVMSSAVAAVAGRGGAVLGAETVASSYPHFFDDLASLA